MKIIKQNEIKKIIQTYRLKDVVLETGTENIFLPTQNKFIVTKGFLKHFSYLFSRCYSLEEVDLTNFDFSEIETMRGWFANTLRLKKILFPKKSKCFKMQSLNKCFYNTNVKNVDLSFMEFHNNKVNFSECFVYTKTIEKVILPKCLSQDLSSIFYGCCNLKKVTLPIVIKKEFTFPLYHAFYKCDNLQLIDCSHNGIVYTNPQEALLKECFHLSQIQDNCVVILSDTKQKK